MGFANSSAIKIWDMRSVGAISLPDPTVVGPFASRRPRGVNSIVESPTTGDLYVLSGDSRVHGVRPTGDMLESYADPALAVSSFFCKLAISPSGQHLAAGSSRGGAVTFDVGSRRSRELGADSPVNSVAWGHDALIASCDDYAARIWRSI